MVFMPIRGSLSLSLSVHVMCMRNGMRNERTYHDMSFVDGTSSAGENERGRERVCVSVSRQGSAMYMPLPVMLLILILLLLLSIRLVWFHLVSRLWSVVCPPFVYDRVHDGSTTCSIRFHSIPLGTSMINKTRRTHDQHMTRIVQSSPVQSSM